MQNIKKTVLPLTVILSILLVVSCESSLHNAAMKDNYKSIQGLVEKGADVNEYNEYGLAPLHIAARNGNIQTMEALIEAGADVFAISNCGSGTALHYALHADKPKAALFLIEEGVPLNPLTKLKPCSIFNTPISALLFAISKDYTEVALAIINAGAFVHPDPEYHQHRNSPLHLAAGRGQPEVVKALLAAGADVSPVNCRCFTRRPSEGNIPLHYAVSGGHLEIVKLLVKAGADIEFKDFDGENSIQRAESQGNKDILQFLLSSNNISNK